MFYVVHFFHVSVQYYSADRWFHFTRRTSVSQSWVDHILTDCSLSAIVVVSHFSWSTLLLLHNLLMSVIVTEQVVSLLMVRFWRMKRAWCVCVFCRAVPFFHCAVHVAIQYYCNIPYCTCIAQIFLQSCLITPLIACSAFSSSCFISIDQHFSRTMFYLQWRQWLSQNKRWVHWFVWIVQFKVMHVCSFCRCSFLIVLRCPCYSTVTQ